jgi:hypothetical protein
MRRKRRRSSGSETPEAGGILTRPLPALAAAHQIILGALRGVPAEVGRAKTALRLARGEKAFSPHVSEGKRVSPILIFREHFRASRVTQPSGGQ